MIHFNGDVSIINTAGGLFQKEIKHHFGNHTLSDRDIDFWKTIANWYVDYERVKNFSHYILSTTANITIIVDHVDGKNLPCKEEFEGYIRCNWRNRNALI